jgi:hypothetical protein
MRDNPNFNSEQVDCIPSVAQLRSLQAGEVLYEPSRPDVPSSFQAGLLPLQLRLGMALICLQQP